MAHLGSAVSALADGQLGPAETERCLAHAAGCPSCAQELAAARQARRLLADAADVEPAADLAARLIALAPPVLPGPAVRREPWPHDEPWPPKSPLTGDVRRRRLPRVFAVATGGIGLAAAGLFMLGDAPRVVPNTHIADPLTVLARAGTSEAQVLPAGEPATTWLKNHGWTSPNSIPQGFSITSVQTKDNGALLEIDVTVNGASGPDIVVRERPGRLDPQAVAGLETWTVSGRQVYVVSEQPWHIVLQSGDTVIDVVSDTQRDAVAQIVAAFPARDYDSGVPARIARGWTAMTGALGTS